MVIGAPLKRNVYLKHYTKEKDDGYGCKYSLCGDYGYCCNVYNSICNVY